MTIHTTHPFADPEPGRDPVRRLRGRLGGAVTLWTAGEGADRAGLTVSSLMVAHGEPGRVLALLDPDADLTDALEETGRAVVQLLRWRHRDLAEVFAGLAPAPGGPFRQATFTPTAWGPRLDGAEGWAGVRLESATEVGWSRLVTCVVEETHLEPAPDAAAAAGDASAAADAPLVHRRGRYGRG
ncbi:flavin reductase family protein [Nocardioides sp. CPCC 205120]|uniref:flavin reductase family protein n=1 Tax=Nocardioides sp. CPCC 205120 TaxID=3406462 RepID=UPI003B50FE1F